MGGAASGASCQRLRLRVGGRRNLQHTLQAVTFRRFPMAQPAERISSGCVGRWVSPDRFAVKSLLRDSGICRFYRFYHFIELEGFAILPPLPIFRPRRLVVPLGVRAREPDIYGHGRRAG